MGGIYYSGVPLGRLSCMVMHGYLGEWLLMAPSMLFRYRVRSFYVLVHQYIIYIGMLCLQLAISSMMW